MEVHELKKDASHTQKSRKSAEIANEALEVKIHNLEKSLSEEREKLPNLIIEHKETMLTQRRVLTRVNRKGAIRLLSVLREMERVKDCCRTFHR